MSPFPVICSYCQKPAVLKSGRDVHPKRQDLWPHQFWCCEPCDARVGCHQGTVEPLGPLADRALRHARMRTHHVFDQLWKDNPEVSRSAAYAWLREQMDLSERDGHIGRFSLEQCLVAIGLCTEKRTTHP